MIKLFLRLAVLTAAGAVLLSGAFAQEPTPITVQLATSTPLPLLGGGSPAQSVLPTPTETPLGPTQLEALETSVNVRAEASTEADRLGIIVPGERYAITGRYFRWLQFRFPNSPTGLGWVYDELVLIIGDELLIPDLSVAAPTADPIVAASTATALAILSVPGGDLTATAGARVLEGPVGIDESTVQAESELNPQGEERLPTFTPAPNVGELVASSITLPTNTPETVLIDLTSSRGSLPPILPIAALIGFGVLGLAVSFIRR